MPPFRLILASGNAHKAGELADLFDPALITVSSAPEKVAVEENGKSFEQNAYLKAAAYHQKFRRPTLADDSGLEVPALPGLLGIHSARFGGENLNDRERTQKLLEKLADKEGAERSARFVCALCFYFSEQEFFFFEGRMEGQIGTEDRGTHGFGYDPVFIPEHAPPPGSHPRRNARVEKTTQPPIQSRRRRPTLFRRTKIAQAKNCAIASPQSGKPTPHKLLILDKTTCVIFKLPKHLKIQLVRV